MIIYICRKEIILISVRGISNHHDIGCVSKLVTLPPKSFGNDGFLWEKKPEIWGSLSLEMHLDIWLWHKIRVHKWWQDKNCKYSNHQFWGQSFWATAICLRKLTIGRIRFYITFQISLFRVPSSRSFSGYVPCPPVHGLRFLSSFGDFRCWQVPLTLTEVECESVGCAQRMGRKLFWQQLRLWCSSYGYMLSLYPSPHIMDLNFLLRFIVAFYGSCL